MEQTSYAIYYPELNKDCTAHAGYLWVEKLGVGVEGVAHLVRSVTNGQLYARKKTLPLPPAGQDYHFREVHFHRPHPRVPALISHTECKILKDIPSDGKERKSLVMISKFCNGGTLWNFREALKTRVTNSKLPESLLWELIATNLEVILFYSNQSLGYLDSHASNIFLHFPKDTSNVPDFYIGDLGHLTHHDEKGGNEFPALYYDAFTLADVVENFSKCDKFNPDNIAASSDGLMGEQEGQRAEEKDTTGAGSKWSSEFSEVLQEIYDMSTFALDLERDPSQREEPYTSHPVYLELAQLTDRAFATLERYKAGAPEDVNFRWARRDWDEPQVWNSSAQLLSYAKENSMPGPFRVARVNEQTWQVVDVDAIDYGIINPLSTEHTKAEFSEGDCIADPLTSIGILVSGNPVSGEGAASKGDIFEEEPVIAPQPIIRLPPATAPRGVIRLPPVSAPQPVTRPPPTTNIQPMTRVVSDQRTIDFQPLINIHPASNVQPAATIPLSTNTQPATNAQPATVIPPATDIQPPANIQPATETTTGTAKAKSPAIKPVKNKNKNKITKPQKIELWHRCQLQKRLHRITECLNDLNKGL